MGLDTTNLSYCSIVWSTLPSKWRKAGHVCIQMWYHGAVFRLLVNFLATYGGKDQMVYRLSNADIELHSAMSYWFIRLSSIQQGPVPWLAMLWFFVVPNIKFNYMIIQETQGPSENSTIRGDLHVIYDRTILKFDILDISKYIVPTVSRAIVFTIYSSLKQRTW